jgi:hypothetical protein
VFFMEVAPAEAAGFWQVAASYHLDPLDFDGESWVDVGVRGCRVDNPDLWDCLTQNVVPDGAWVEVARDDLVLIPFVAEDGAPRSDAACIAACVEAGGKDPSACWQNVR